MRLRRRQVTDLEIHKTSEVFGIERDIPENYVTRKNVDYIFVESLTESKHIVVYGSSKQGKTSLRKYNLNPDEYITIVCSNTTTLAQLQGSMLKEAAIRSSSASLEQSLESPKSMRRSRLD